MEKVSVSFHRIFERPLIIKKTQFRLDCTTYGKGEAYHKSDASAYVSSVLVILIGQSAKIDQSRCQTTMLARQRGINVDACEFRLQK